MGDMVMRFLKVVFPMVMGDSNVLMVPLILKPNNKTNLLIIMWPGPALCLPKKQSPAAERATGLLQISYLPLMLFYTGSCNCERTRATFHIPGFTVSVKGFNRTAFQRLLPVFA